jgi:hypothetical protein
MLLELNEEQKNYIDQRLQSFDNHRLDYGPDDIADIFLNECVNKKMVNVENEDQLFFYHQLFLDYIENN